MIVAELIKELQKLPPENKIITLQDDEVVTVTEDKNNILTVCVS